MRGTSCPDIQGDYSGRNSSYEIVMRVSEAFMETYHHLPQLLIRNRLWMPSYPTSYTAPLGKSRMETDISHVATT